MAEAGGSGVAAHDRARVGLADYVQALRQRLGPLAELRPVGNGHAEQHADDAHRQRVGEIVHQVEVATRLGGVQQLVDEPLDLSSQPADRGRRERSTDQAAQPRVVGRVAKQHPLTEAARQRPFPDCRPKAVAKPGPTEARIPPDRPAISAGAKASKSGTGDVSCSLVKRRRCRYWGESDLRLRLRLASARASASHPRCRGGRPDACPTPRSGRPRTPRTRCRPDPCRRDSGWRRGR